MPWYEAQSHENSSRSYIFYDVPTFGLTAIITLTIHANLLSQDSTNAIFHYNPQLLLLKDLFSFHDHSITSNTRGKAFPSLQPRVACALSRLPLPLLRGTPPQRPLPHLHKQHPYSHSKQVGTDYFLDSLSTLQNILYSISTII